MRVFPCLSLLLGILTCPHAYAAPEGGDAADGCSVPLHAKIPNGDLLAGYEVASLPREHEQLTRLNAALSPGLRVSDAEFEKAFFALTLLPRVGLPLRQFFAEASSPSYILNLDSGDSLGEWETPVHDYLKYLAAKVIPDREQLIELRKTYARDAKDIDPITAYIQHKFAAFPNFDLLFEHSVSNLPGMRVKMGLVNAALSPALRLSDEVVEKAFERMMWGSGSREFIQLNDMFTKPGERSHFVTIAPGQLGEWEKPIHDWLVWLSEQPALSREEAELRQKSHDRYQDYINPIESYRLELIKAKVAEATQRLGQVPFTEHELRNYASVGNGLSEVEARLEHYQPGQAGTHSIASIKTQIGKIGANLRDYLRTNRHYRDRDKLVSRILAMNDPAVFAELDYYASLGPIRSARADLISTRLAKLETGKTDFQETIRTLLVDEIRSTIRAKGMPGVMIFTPVQALAPKSELENARWDEAQVEFLGAWTTSSIPRAFGMTISPEPIVSTTEVVAVEVPVGQGRKYFAVQVFGKYTDGRESRKIAESNYRTLDEIELRGIRQVTTPPRVQDAFRTFPPDLREPLVELSDFSGNANPDEVPNQILIERVKGSFEATDRSGMLEVAGRALGDAMNGAPKGEYANIRLFRDFRQSGSGQLYLPLVQETPGRQIYAQEVPAGTLQRISITLTRNTVTDTYTLKVKRTIGVGRFSRTLGSWEGIYRTP